MEEFILNWLDLLFLESDLILKRKCHSVLLLISFTHFIRGMRYGCEDNFQICMVLFTPSSMLPRNQYHDDIAIIAGFATPYRNKNKKCSIDKGHKVQNLEKERR